MKDKELEVGKEYTNEINRLQYILVYKNDTSVLVEIDGHAVLLSKEYFKMHYTPAPIERDKVELFQTCTDFGDVRLCDSSGRGFDKVNLKWHDGSVYKQNRSKTPVAYLYTDDFSIEWIMDRDGALCV